MIEWDDKYSVGISKIDDEHRQFIDIINMAIATKEHKDNPEELREVLYRITKYALNHFSTEENYMIEFNYPEYQYHKEEHHDKRMLNFKRHKKASCGQYHDANNHGFGRGGTHIAQNNLKR